LECCLLGSEASQVKTGHDFLAVSISVGANNFDPAVKKAWRIDSEAMFFSPILLPSLTT